MALQPFVRILPLFQFLNSLLSLYDFLDGESARFKAATHTVGVGYEPSIPVPQWTKTVQASERAAAMICDK
jgi:hypothetical protein